MFASSYKDVHKWNTALGRSMALGSGGAEKEMIHHVLESRPFDVAHGVVASRWRMRIKLSKDGETCIGCTVSDGLALSKNLLVCIGAHLGRGCVAGMVFCGSEVRNCGKRRG
jgi:hypothetical protein